MDSSKAKKAKSKAKSRKQQKGSAEQQAANAMMAAQAMQGAGQINPEIQAQQTALQPQFINPYGRMGTVAPNVYNPGNMVNGN